MGIWINKRGSSTPAVPGVTYSNFSVSNAEQGDIAEYSFTVENLGDARNIIFTIDYGGTIGIDFQEIIFTSGEIKNIIFNKLIPIDEGSPRTAIVTNDIGSPQYSNVYTIDKANIEFGIYAVAATAQSFDYEILNSTSMQINWGDGNIETLTGTATASHTYSTTGNYNASIIPIDGDITDFVYYFANNTLNFDGVVDFSKADNIAYFYHGQNVYFNGISLFKFKSNVAMSRFGYVTETGNDFRTSIAQINIVEVTQLADGFLIYGVEDLQLNEDIFFNMPSNFVSFRNTSSSITGLTNTNNSFSFMTFGLQTVFDNFESLNFTNITSNTSSLNIAGICISTTQSDNLMISIADSATLNNVQNKTLDFTNNSALSATGLAALATLTDPAGLNWTVTVSS